MLPNVPQARELPYIYHVEASLFTLRHAFTHIDLDMKAKTIFSFFLSG